MNSTHPFYPILIPNTSYVNFFIFFVFVVPVGPKTLKKILIISKIISTRVFKKMFLIKKKKLLGVPKFKTKPFIFEYFLKIPSEMNSTHNFYTILLPMITHAKIFILFTKSMISKVISTRVCKKIFLIKAKKKLYRVSQNLGPKPSFFNIF